MHGGLILCPTHSRRQTLPDNRPPSVVAKQWPVMTHTIMEAPESSSACTQGRVPDSAARCTAVYPFSDRVSA